MSRWLGIFSLVFVPVTGFAFEANGNRWETATSVFFVDIPGTSPSGISWNESFEDAMAQWSQQTDFTFLINGSYLDPCESYGPSANPGNADFPGGKGDSLNAVDFSSSVCGNEFGSGVLAITLIISDSGFLGFSNLTQTDIIFNSNVPWDIYQGNTRLAHDFGRTALHELGHSLGLSHEMAKPAIMAPSLTNLFTLQQDDIDGANALYGAPTDCLIPDIEFNTVIHDSLDEGDCTLLEFYGGGNDDSYVDTYRLILDTEKRLSLLMESSSVDSVLLVTDSNRVLIEFDDDSGGGCNALITATFPAGEYLILANTYTAPTACSGITGPYRLSISDSTRPLLNDARSISGGISNAIFSGGASIDNGSSFGETFMASDAIDVSANIQIAPEHIGQPGSLYVLAILNHELRFVKIQTGEFVLLSGGVADIPAFQTDVLLGAMETINIVENLVGENMGLSGYSFEVFVGYSLSNDPAEIFFNGEPISFSIL